MTPTLTFASYPYFKREFLLELWSLFQHINLLKAVSIAPSVTRWPSSSTLHYAPSNSSQFISNQLTHLLGTFHVLGLVVGTTDKQGKVSSLEELVTWCFETVNVTTFIRQDMRWKKCINKTESVEPSIKENLFATFELSWALKGQRWRKCPPLLQPNRANSTSREREASPEWQWPLLAGVHVRERSLQVLSTLGVWT